jgi:hypothetical protein
VAAPVRTIGRAISPGEQAMRDLKNPQLIHLKGWLFLGLGFLAAATLLAEWFSFKAAILLTICVWAFCRFYYYAFYVVENYLDPGYKFTGLWSLARYLLRKRQL